MNLRITDPLQSCTPTSLMQGRFMKVRSWDLTVEKSMNIYSTDCLTVRSSYWVPVCLLSLFRPQVDLPLWTRPANRLWQFSSESSHRASVRISSTTDPTLSLQQRVSAPSPGPTARTSLCVITGKVLCVKKWMAALVWKDTICSYVV